MKTIVIKCGGSVLDELTDSFFASLKEMVDSGARLVIVHGGGPDINSMLEKFSIQSQFVKGLRKTTKETLDVAELVLAGRTNRKLVDRLQQAGIAAIGVNGSDANLLVAKPINVAELGLVGEVESVNAPLIRSLCEARLVPVITPIATSPHGQKLNVNADYAASSVASVIQADECLFVTDVDGILVDKKVKEEITSDEINQLIELGVIYGGMIPKVQSALNAIHKGLTSVRIVNGTKPLKSTQKWHGTKITRKEGVIQ